MTEAHLIAETARRAIVDMLWRKQDMKAARWVENMPVEDLLPPPRPAAPPAQPPATFGDHLGVLNCPGYYSAAQHAESMAEVFGAHRMP